MRLPVRCAVASALVLVLAGCGVTSDEVGDDTTSTTTSTTVATTESSTTTTTEATTTTDGGRIDDDPELAALLLTADDFGGGLEMDPDSDAGIEEEFCEGQSFTVLPVEQASVGYETSAPSSFVAEAIAEFGFEDDASLFMEELQTLNDACKITDDDDALPATFEPIADLGDEAIRAIPDPGSDPFEVIVVRADERVILLASSGDQQLLTNSVIIEAVDPGLSVNGVGPHPQPWPDDDRLDPDLLAGGDTRNVVDRYRYWRMEAIISDLDQRRHPFHVAIENWEHDRNIGTIVRTANVFLAAEVHIIGHRRWNRRGAMVTEQYQHLHHHATIEDLLAWAGGAGLPIVGVDILPGAVPLDRADVPERCVLLFGQEGPGLSQPARAAATTVVSIRQYGSTRSLNAGVAAGIAMHDWLRRWAAPTEGR